MADHRELVDFLRSREVSETTIAAAVASGDDDIRRLAMQVSLLGSAPDLTPGDVAYRAGAPRELSEALWRAMGFARVPDDAPALADIDVDALGRINDYLETTGVAPDTAIRFTRLLGQSMSRVADALLSIVDAGLADIIDPDAVDDAGLLLLMGEVVNPLVEHEIGYLLRRHLLAGAERRIASPTVGDAPTTVGFADVVSFTRLSGQLPEGGLADLLERFEAVTADEIVDHGGRVVKLIGDAVMFEFESPSDAAHCGLHLVESFGGDHPDLRVGLAHGPVIGRLGDLFGPTVNLASRLVGFARPGTVLVDAEVAAAIDADRGSGLVSKSMRPRDLKGIGVTPMHVVRRPGDDGPPRPRPEIIERRRERVERRVERLVAVRPPLMPRPPWSNPESD